MPTNLYGPGDNFDLQSSHVVPALMWKLHEAKLRGDSAVEIWGTGAPRREFMHVDDCADGIVFLSEHYSDEEHINIGTGRDVTIRELAALIARVVGYTGEFRYDATKPDGTPRKLLDVSRLTSLGWQSRTELEDGLRQTYAWYCENVA
jgi:GDP-L-fucose synthase